ncbi:acyl-CoA dehydrogenase family protein [Streptomyces sp. WA6-1-16]|uniref:acyl-CoA dehydrogenase family protein n=1 Tax=Streptomyces sp. WA6-1-16 TaxID=2879427 RepID=UPI001CE36693|nr:acyl-CoA dehydrogenase family protein [Streptomyces sp. WA6-1-16]UCA48292.1 acyl-CoA dehydrogenase family protein [Streptomyces sp. WA6-1-16]
MATLTNIEPVAAARALAPRLREHAAEADRLRTLPDATVRLLDEARLFDVLTPRELGGTGLGFDTAVLVAEELSRGCASAGWVCAVLGGTAWAVAQMAPRAREEVFAGPSTRIALQLRLGGPPAERVADGYLLHGMRGRFCSGIDHADWILAGVSAPRTAGADPEPHFALLPRERTEGVDDWHTSGLRGTGSHSFTTPAAPGLLVPEHRVLPLSALDPLNTSPYGRPGTAPYRMAHTAVGTVALAGVLLGTARAALDAHTESADRGSGPDALDVPALTATVDAARALLLADLKALADSATPGGSREERARMRRDIAHAGTRCRAVVNAVYEASGSGVIYDDAPLQRIWRDANAAAQHPTFDLRRWGPPHLEAHTEARSTTATATAPRETPA